MHPQALACSASRLRRRSLNFVPKTTASSINPESAEMIRFRVALAERGLALGELGRQLGLAEGTIYSYAAAHFTDSIRLRWRIEALLDYGFAIWTSRDVLEIRRGCRLVFGLDPFLAEKSALLDLARRVGVPLTNTPRTVSGYRGAIVRFLAVNRRLITPAHCESTT